MLDVPNSFTKSLPHCAATQLKVQVTKRPSFLRLLYSLYPKRIIRASTICYVCPWAAYNYIHSTVVEISCPKCTWFWTSLYLSSSSGLFCPFLTFFVLFLPFFKPFFLLCVSWAVNKYIQNCGGDVLPKKYLIWGNITYCMLLIHWIQYFGTFLFFTFL